MLIAVWYKAHIDWVTELPSLILMLAILPPNISSLSWDNVLIAVWYKAHGRHVDWATELSSLILLLAFLEDAFSKAFLRISEKI